MYAVSSQEYCSGLPALLQEIFPTQDQTQVSYVSCNWQVSSLPLTPPGKPLISDHFDTKEISLEVQSDVKNRQFKLAQEVRKQW